MKNRVGRYPNLPSNHRFNLQAAQVEWEQNREVTFRAMRLESGRLAFHITGMDLRDYGSIVGPEGVAEHRDFVRSRNGERRMIIEPTRTQRVMHLGRNIAAIAVEKINNR